MSDNYEIKLKRAKEVVLDSKERASLKSALFEYLHLHPKRAITAYRSLRFFKAHAMVAVFMFALLMGGGTSYAAEGALPGDVLYVVKVDINERARVLFAKSPEARAAVHAELAVRRIEEAEHLALEGRLDTDAKNNIEVRFQKHTQEIRSGLLSAEAENIVTAANISTNFEASLDAHEKVLGALIKEKGDGAEADVIKELRIKVRTQGNDTKSDRKKKDAETTRDAEKAKRAATGKQKSAVRKITEVENFLIKKGDGGEGGMATPLADAKKLLEDGDRAVAKGDFGSAFELYQEAHKSAEASKRTFEAELLLNVRVEKHDDDDDGGEPADIDDKENTSEESLKESLKRLLPRDN